MASAIEFVPLETDMMDDPKVSALLDDLSDGDASARFAAYGRLILVFQRIYHSGFYMRYGKFERRKLMKDTGLTEDGLDAFIGACAECEVLDSGMLSRGVLTSRGIQRRYFRARKTARSAVSDEDSAFIIETGRSAAVRRDSPNFSEIRRDSPRSSEIPREAPSLKREEKTREGKRREEEEGARGCAAPSGSSSSSLPSIADPEGGEPLSCLALVSDPTAQYFDAAGEAFDTPWAALASTFAERTHGRPIAPFARQVAGLCPPGCRRDLESVERCARLLQKALARYDPGKGSPFPLARKIIEDERGDVR